MLQVMIVEDEHILRKGILTLTDWASLGCTVVKECKNGIEALAYLENNHADIVITDIRMPGMDGLELTGKIQEYENAPQIIILTAYADFHYAQTALKLNVFDYVIKANFVDELPKSLARLREKLESASIKDTLPPVNNPKDLQQIVMKSIFSGEMQDPEKLEHWLEFCDMKLNYYYVSCLRLYSGDRNVSPEISDFFDQIAQEETVVYFKVKEDLLLLLFKFNQGNRIQNQLHVTRSTKEIMSTLSHYMGFETNFGISVQHESVYNLPQAFEEAMSALNHILGTNKVVLYQDLEEAANSLETNDAAETLLALILDDKFEECLVTIEKLFVEKYQKIKNLQQVRISLLLTAKQLAHDLLIYVAGKKELDNIVNSLSGSLAACTSIQDIYLSFCSAIETFVLLNKKALSSRDHLVSVTMEFIRENYMRSVNLTEIANNLHVNRSYLCRVFKKATGKSIINTLNQIRIDKAKEVLLADKHQIHEIGELVGIDDPAYFSRVFTKYTKMTPREYIQQRRRER